MLNTQDTSFVLEILNQLLGWKSIMLHSDQCSVNTFQACQEAVKGNGITMSMHRKGTPVDNATIESFYLKQSA